MIPQHADLFFSPSLSISLIVAFATGWVLVFLHELAHLMAARSLGVGSRIGLSHRLVFAVAETNMSNIVLLPPAKRYRAYFAGMAWDVTFLSLGIWVLFAHDVGWLSVPIEVVAFLQMVNLIIIMSLVFQFMFFMETDIYYVFTTLFRCQNLLANTRLYLRRFFFRLSDDELAMWEYVTDHEKKVIQWYGWFYLFGLGWTVWFFYAFQLQIAIDFIVRIVGNIYHQSIFSWAFVDGMLLILLTLVPFIIVVSYVSRAEAAAAGYRTFGLLVDPT
ncbi:hypothetical protein LOK74_10345 [Brevibacillus humidisoli]|uniref:hypothetical protein n=1 Tax=Brevibacillus humidisoli TaxID=2895522 RepID=UPI001E32034C|nr:hypothetical protein [Brevibacillus humidisoli]UFJ42857.1 hypothetical protein LOK74_10345 [Brevibacillus humidisoli]